MSLKNMIYEKWTEVANYVQNPLSTSKFLEEGVLTPQEFVEAGDLLVLKCPSWVWQSAKSLQKGLPKEKQFLLTKNVPCLMRVSAFEAKSNNSENKQVETEDGEGGWTQTHINDNPQEEILEIPTTSEKTEEELNEDAPEIDLDSLSVKETEIEDKATLLTDNIVRTRTYDISICYDQYHQTPRVWLFGYDENKQPLTPEKVLQDMSEDHVNKTVTVAQHPHTSIMQAYIHPCKHASVMKKIVNRMIESGRVPRVDQYLFIFLKFIHAAIPTIEYDFTIEMDLH